MERQRVDSSSVRSVGYDGESHTLEVEFRNGGVYDYLDVPETEARRLRQADSLGRYLNMRIKPRYRVRKVRPPSAE
ncbi:MAG TPA: KTSC domain-containing protein [Longimicrobium sp.]